MVSIVPTGSSSIGATGLPGTVRPDAREKSSSTSDSATPAVIEDASSESAWRIARQNAADALKLLDLAVSFGQSALDFARQGAAAARDGDGAALSAATEKLRAALADADVAGVGLLSGEDYTAALEPGGAALTIEGVDFSALLLSDSENFGAAQSALSQWTTIAGRLETHSALLGVVEQGVASSVRQDLDADAARLLALQVKQGLSATGASLINAKPSSVLSLFRS